MITEPISYRGYMLVGDARLTVDGDWMPVLVIREAPESRLACPGPVSSREGTRPPTTPPPTRWSSAGTGWTSRPIPASRTVPTPRPAPGNPFFTAPRRRPARESTPGPAPLAASGGRPRTSSTGIGGPTHDCRPPPPDRPPGRPMPFATVNGIRLYYEWHGATDATPVVLVMGLGTDSSAWQFQVAALAPRHRVLVFDNRGVGQSEAPDVPTPSGAWPTTSSASSGTWEWAGPTSWGSRWGVPSPRKRCWPTPTSSRASSSTPLGRGLTLTSRPWWRRSGGLASASTARASTGR